jgi:hypothetical protein
MVSGAITTVGTAVGMAVVSESVGVTPNRTGGPSENGVAVSLGVGVGVKVDVGVGVEVAVGQGVSVGAGVSVGLGVEVEGGAMDGNSAAIAAAAVAVAAIAREERVGMAMVGASVGSMNIDAGPPLASTAPTNNTRVTMMRTSAMPCLPCFTFVSNFDPHCPRYTVQIAKFSVVSCHTHILILSCISCK